MYIFTIEPILLPTHREVASIVFDSLRCDEAPNGEPGGTVRLVALQDRVAPSHRHVINHPLVHVTLVDSLAQKLKVSLAVFFLCVSLFTELLAVGYVLTKLDLERRDIWKTFKWNHMSFGVCVCA